MMATVGKILFGMLLTGVGLAVGFVLASPPPEVETVSHAGCGGGEAVSTPDVLSPQTLKSMGVDIGPAVKQDFVRHRKVQAVVMDRPLNRRPITATRGGIVTAVHVQTGEAVMAGALLMTMARDPIARPKPELTADLLLPISEDVHAAASNLRLAMSEIAVTKTELDRIAPFVEARTIPGKTAIDLRYQLARSEQVAANARMELHTHGLSGEEIAQVAGGEHPPQTRQLWRRSLEEAGLWNAQSDRVWVLLPEAQRDLPWCIVAVGELSAAGLVTDQLVSFLEQEKGAPLRFAEIAGLLLEGMPLGSVRLLLREGALEAEVQIRAPRSGPEDWDVEAIAVRPGQRVEAGTELLTLYDARTMWLRLQPVGIEIGLVTRAMEEGSLLTATPLIDDSGPDLQNVRLARMAMQSQGHERGGIAHAVVSNVALGCAVGVPCRSWQLRVGLRYLVQVPTQQLPGRFVLPTDAVASQGPDRIVFIQNGDTFTAQPVHVEYSDEEVVVIADDGSLFDGDPVVLSGAFALSLAIGRGSEEVDPHAGHSHN
jgi:multidrug efflux pump subunit AcrA (membrane-fusion protein)